LATGTIPVAVYGDYLLDTPVVIFAFPGAVPMVAARPFRCHSLLKAGVEPPMFPCIHPSFCTATISGAVTVT
jgi:hypothetical protein